MTPIHFPFLWPLVGILGMNVIRHVKSQDKYPDGFYHRVCQHLCHRIFGCSSSEYVTTDLSCHVTYNRKRPTSSDTGRYNIQNCQGITSQGQASRLLMLPYSSSRQSHSGRLLYFQNNSLVEFPAVRTRKVIGAGFIPSSRRVVVLNSVPPELRIISLDSGKTILKKRWLLLGVSVDEARQVIYMTSPSRVYVMTTNGKQFRSVVQLSVRGGDIAADSKRSLLYVIAISTKILKFTYKGAALGAMTEGYIRYSLCLDAERNFLYYMQGESASVFKMSVTDNSVLKVVDIGSDAWDLFVSGGALYVTPSPFKGYIFVYYENATIHKIDIGYRKSLINTISLCGLP